jgi:hypothetical protein
MLKNKVSIFEYINAKVDRAGLMLTKELQSFYKI